MSLREELAAVQHEIWAHWMQYLFSVCRENEDGSYTIPGDKVRRWKRQMKTDYDELLASERESDLEQADKVINILRQKY